MRETSTAVTVSKRATKASPARQRLLFALLAFSSLTSGGTALAAGGALPTGGHFVGGQGAITQGGNHLTVNQTSQLGIINWQSFSIGKGNSVTIDNGNGATLNRVTGGGLTTIAGSLKATGSVYVVNQAGVVVGPSGRVATGGSFVASSRDVSNPAFMAGGAMELSGSSSGTVDNQGTITSSNGDVVLVGKSVSNSGSIGAAKGSATLAAGDKVLLQASGDDTVLVETGSGDVTNTGTVQAAQVALNAKGGNVYALAVNDGGVIRATGTATKDGHVYLTAGDDLTVNSSVSANNADGSGGEIVATGKAVSIGARAKIAADGAGNRNGGTILIGGDRHGGADRADALSDTTIANAQTNTVAAGARISANAGTRGKGSGGNVVVWSDDATNYQGKISAKGGIKGGDGGFVEVSGKQVLGFTGRVDTKAMRGKTGTLLLDPSDVVIYSSTDSVLGGTGTSGENQSGGNFNPNSSTSFILNTDIDAALATSNVVISTGTLTDGLGGTGNISIGTNNGNAFDHAAPIHWNTSNSLTLNAVGIINTPGGNPNASTGGASTLNPGALIDSQDGGAIFFNAGGNGQTPGIGTTVISLQGNIMGTGGLISLVATNPGFRIEFNNNQGITNTTDFGAGKVILQADEVHLGTSTGPSGFVQTPGEVDIAPTSAGAVILGDNSASGDYSSIANTALTRAEDIANVVAGTLVIGSTSTTSITLEVINQAGHMGFSGLDNTAFDAAQAQNLKLLTAPSGTVTQDGNSPILVNDTTFSAFSPGSTLNGSGGLAVQAGTITLNNAQNSVGSIAFKETGTGGNISFTSATSTDNTLVVGTVGDISGISTVGARTVTLAISGDTVTQTAGAANAIAPTSGSIKLELTGTDSSFTLDNPANAVTTIAANVQSLTYYNNVDLSTGTAGSTTGVSASGDVTIVDNGQLTIGSGAGIATTGGNIRVEDQTFVNSDGANAFSAGTGKNWRVYSQDPRNDSANTAALTYGFVQYGATNSYADPFSTANAALDSHATGNGFLFTVAPSAAVTLTGPFNKTYDGNNTVTQTIGNSAYGTPTGLINGDQATFISLSDTGATYSTKNAGTNLAITLSQSFGFASFQDANGVTVYGYGTTATNNIKGTISPLGVTVSGTRVYDGTTGAAGTILTVSGEISGDPTLSVTGSGAVGNKNVGTSKNISNLGTLALSGTGSGNYSIASGTLTITPLDVTVTGSRTYDGTTTADSSNLTVVGEISGDPTLTVTGSGSVTNKNVGTLKNISTLGTLALSGTGASNYNLASGTLTITPLGLTVSGTRVYDGTTTADSSILTLSGEISGDPTLTVTGSGSVANKNVGTSKALTDVSGLGLTGTGSGNYTIASGTLTITPLDVTVSGTRVYDGTTGAAGTILTVSGEISGDPTLTVTGSGSVTNKNVGTSKNISNLGTLALSGTGAGNYSIASGTLTITPLDVTVTGTRTYDGTTTADSSNLTVVGEISGDPTLSVTGSGAVTNKNAGTSKNISNLGTLALSGTGAGNYNLASGTLTITPLGLTVSGTRIYDGTTGASGTILTVSGEISGDPTLTVTGSGSVTNKNVGTSKNISNLGTLGLSGTGAGNYSIASGTLTITPLDVTVTGSRTYDGTTTASGGILSVVGEISGDGTLTVTGSGAVGNKNAGTSKNISTLGSLALSGTNAGNYNIVSGTLTITPLGLTVSGTRTYDGTTGASGTILTVSGEISGDPTLTVTGTGQVANKNVGTSKNIANLGTLGLSGTGAGNYTIASGTLTVTQLDVTVSGTRSYDGSTTAAGSYLTVNGEISGDPTLSVTGSGNVADPNAGNNKNITNLGTLGLAGTGAGNYHIVSGTLTITPADVTLANISGTRVYDGTTNANGSYLTITNLVSGDHVGVAGLGTLASKNVGKEQIVDLGTLHLTGADASNYTLSDSNPNDFVIVTQATLTVSAVTQTKVYDGTTTSTLTPTIAGLQTGDSITGTKSQSYNSPDVLGTNGSTLTALHDIGVNDGNGGGNYVIVYKTAKGTITPESIVISAVTQTKVYDGTTVSTGTPTLTDGTLYNGDTLSGLGQAFNSKNVLGTNGSTLTVDPGYTLTHAGNYTVTLKTAKGTITPLAIDATGMRVYDSTPDVDGGILTITNLIGGDTVGLSGTGTSSSPHVGTHDITGGDLVLTGPDAHNYTLTGGHETVKITPFAVVLYGVRVYDGETDGDGSILAVTNAFKGDDVTVASGTSTIISKDVGIEKITDFGTLTLGGTSSGDYTLIGATGKVKVTPEMLTVTAVPDAKTYDGTDTSTGTPIVTIGTVFTGDTGDFIQTFSSQHAHTGLTLTPSGTVDDGNGGKNYIIKYVPIADGTINPRPVDLFGTRPFDNGTDANSTILTITNLVPGDNVMVGGNTGTVISPNVGPEKIIDFTGLTLGGTSSGDYTLVGATGIVDITPASTPNNNPGTQIDNQTASGNGTQSNFVVPDSGLITLTPRQNGIVTGTIATIDGTDYQPDAQLGCTLGAAGCVQNGVAPTTTSTPQ